MGHGARGADPRAGEQGTGAVDRRGPGADRSAHLHHPVHPETAARIVRAQGPRGGSMNARLDRLGVVFAAALALAAILVPTLSLATPADSAFHLPPYLVQLLAKHLCYAILAVAPSLVWGY